MKLYAVFLPKELLFSLEQLVKYNLGFLEIDFKSLKFFLVIINSGYLSCIQAVLIESIDQYPIVYSVTSN